MSVGALVGGQVPPVSKTTITVVRAHHDTIAADRVQVQQRFLWEVVWVKPERAVRLVCSGIVELQIFNVPTSDFGKARWKITCQQLDEWFRSIR